MAVTMKDIAMLAGVSRQAVASALNGNGSSRVSEENRRKILRIAKETNYVPNSAARRLKGVPSKTIGFMAPIANSGVISGLSDEISHMLIARGYNILYNNYSWSNRSAAESLLHLVARGVDGIIIYDSGEKKVFDTNQTVPHLFYSSNDDKDVDIALDNEYGGYLATKHLLGHGHAKVMILMVTEAQKRGRYCGWQRAHKEAGIEVSDNDVIVLRELGGSVEKTVELLRRKKTTAIFAYNDFIAAKLMKILEEHQIRVPEDIAIIGYDGYALCEFTSSSLTTVIQPLREQAESCVKLLLERIGKKELHSPPARHLVKPVLHKGGSCGCKPENIKNFYQINTFDMMEKDAKINFDIDIFKK